MMDSPSEENSLAADDRASIMRPIRVATVQLDGLPFGLTSQGRYWIPAEPLASPSVADGEELDETLSTASLFSSIGSNASQVLRRIEQFATNPMVDKLSEVLAFLNSHHADLIVLPEYIVPEEALHVLLGYSSASAIVAGIGLVRNTEQAERLSDLSSDRIPVSDLLGRNAAAVVHQGQVRFVCKRYPAEAEAAIPGDGVDAFDIVVNGRQIRVAVAICLDFLRMGDAILDLSPEVVCISAYTPAIRPFEPDAPRDFLRVFANCARHGGTTIFAPSLRGPCFTSPLGVRALPSGVEGIVMVEHDRYRQTPSSLRRTENRLILRSEIVTRDDNNEAALTAITALSEMGSAGWAAGDFHTRISRWLDHLTDIGPLRESLEEYRRALAQEIHDEELMTLLVTHTTTAPGARVKDVRVAQSDFLVGRLGELVASGNPIPNVGRMIDAYQTLAGSLTGRRTLKSFTSDARWTFGLRLGPYDGESAVSTLPRQLSFLRSLRTLPPKALEVTYRLHTSRTVASPDLVALFDVIVSGDGSIVEAEQVEAQMRSMFVASWPVSSSDEPALPLDARHFATVKLLGKEVPAAREDWASLADLLRTHDIPIAVDMRVQRGKLSIDDVKVRVPAEANELAWLNAFPAIAAGEGAERRAMAFYSVISETGREPEPRDLEFTLMVSSAEPVPELLLVTIAREVFGSLDFEVTRGSHSSAESETCVLNPAEAIRIFHPPYGRMQSRGTAKKKDHELPFRGGRLPEVGTQLGTARLSGPRMDHRREVRLDESARARHVYVVGKTGTGKTNFLKEVCRQDIEAGRGLAVVDPHGDLVDYLVDHCASRLPETVLLDFGRRDFLPRLNPLMVDVSDKRTEALHTTDFLRALESRYYSEFTGPVFDDMVRMAIETMFAAETGARPSLDLVETMYRNRDLRLMVPHSLPTGSTLRDRWNVFEQLPEKEKAERITWMLAKFADLLPEGSPLRLSLCSSSPSSLSIERLVWSNGVLLVKLPEASLGPDAASFLGSLIVRRIQRAVFDFERGTGRSIEERPVFTLCIDEFQKFATSGLEGLLAEARKFRCGLIMAHQNFDQLFAFSRFEGARSRELLDAIMGNVGTVVAFRVGPQDAEALSELLACNRDDVAAVPKYKALCRLTVDDDESPPFTLTVEDAARRRGLPATGEAAREAMKDQGIWASIADTAIMVAGNAAAYEARLRQDFSGIVRDEKTEIAQTLMSDVADGLLPMDELVNRFDPDGEISANFLLDLVAEIVKVNLELEPGLVDEVARRLIDSTDNIAQEDDDVSYEAIKGAVDQTLASMTTLNVSPTAAQALAGRIAEVFDWLSGTDVDLRQMFAAPESFLKRLLGILAGGEVAANSDLLMALVHAETWEDVARTLPTSLGDAQVRGIRAAHFVIGRLRDSTSFTPLV